jgi:hypothetical protein
MLNLFGMNESSPDAWPPDGGKGQPAPTNALYAATSTSRSAAFAMPLINKGGRRDRPRRRRQNPACRGGQQAGSAWGSGLGGRRGRIIGPPRKARMTELHDIHVIHRTVSTGKLESVQN